MTYDDLLTRAEARLARSQASTRAGRQLLVDLLAELRGNPTDNTATDLLDDTGWRLDTVEVQGFCGIGNARQPLRLDLTPAPGITVVRGANGTGKSSLAGAITWLLTGRAPGAQATAGDLWQASAIADAAAAADLRLTLTRGGSRLTFHGSLRPDGDELTVELNGTAVEPGPSWHEALTASNACFAYAGLQDRLRRQVDLQTYLEGLLVLGPVWIDVQRALAERAERALRAEKELNRAKRTAMSEVDVLTARFGADPRRPVAPAPFGWPPSWADDPAEWAGAHGLDTETAAEATPPLPPDVEAIAAHLGAELDAADRALAAAETGVADPATTAVLHHLQALVDHDDLPERHCPLCGEATAWREPARATLARLATLAAERARVAAALAELHD